MLEAKASSSGSQSAEMPVVVIIGAKAQAFLQTAAAQIPPGGSILEIGTFCGGSAVIMARANPLVTVHTVDPNEFSWLKRDRSDPFIELLHTHWPQISWTEESVLNLRQQYLKKYPNIQFHRGKGRSVAFSHPFDLCFIDGDHRTLEVVADFWHCWAMTKKGGRIIGDDIVFDSVKEAVKIIEGGLGRPVEHYPELNMFSVVKTSEPVF